MTKILPSTSLSQDDENTMQSGTKLVLGIFGLAVAAGVLSWWYRYEAAHRSTTFWGPHFAELIATPSEVSAFGLEEISPPEPNNTSFTILDKSYNTTNQRDITKVPGMVHLRNAILSDSNYHWDHEINNDDWRWCVEFTGDGHKATILFNEDFTILGRMNQRADQIRVVDCEPMAETLREYFQSSEIFATTQQDVTASKPAE
jgi:hypothetical protein